MPIKILLAFGIAAAAKLRNDTRQAPPVAVPFASYSKGIAPMHHSPIEPSWILDGQPQARLSRNSVGFDGTAGSVIWDCTAGTFRWYFDRHETVVILEGSVHVTDEKGNERILEAGDTAFFSAGTWATWRIERYVRKAAFIKRPIPKPVATAMGLLRGLKRATGTGSSRSF